MKPASGNLTCGHALRAFATTLGASVYLLATNPVHAIELKGAWANDESACPKIFERRGDRIAISRSADIYGSGFIIEENRIRGQIATCAIKSRKQDGAVLHMHTTCSTDVALQDVQFSVRPESDNKIIRIFPGIAELDRPYYRCAFQGLR